LHGFASQQAAKKKNNNMSQITNHYVVILAGGKGERLWPLSREKKPKQLLPLLDSKTLLELTLERVTTLAARDNTWIMTTTQYKDQIRKITHDTVGTIITEPATRNTAPAILLTCLEIAQKNPDAVITFLPSDHFIPDARALCSALTQAAAYATKNNVIVLLGNKPTFAATGYGYIEYDTTTAQDGIYAVQKFHEKPDQATAEQYLQQHNFLWNGGMFVGRARTFIDEFKQHAPQLFNDIEKFRNGALDYAHIASISIDHAIMEKSSNITLLPVHFAWSDIGNLRVFLELQEHLNKTQTPVMTYRSNNNLVHAPRKLVALIDVENLCIVDTGDVLLIGNQHSIEHVKNIVGMLKETDTATYL
jgi:mannose-1-phosphate guanylyltransferase